MEKPGKTVLGDGRRPIVGGHPGSISRNRFACAQGPVASEAPRHCPGRRGPILVKATDAGDRIKERPVPQASFAHGRLAIATFPGTNARNPNLRKAGGNSMCTHPPVHVRAETSSRSHDKNQVASKLLAGTVALALTGSAMALAGCGGNAYAGQTAEAQHRPAAAEQAGHQRALVAEGKRIFRYDTFGDESFWTDKLKMNDVIQMEVSPKVALAVGLKVDVDALPAAVKQGIKNGAIDLDDPATTLALLKLNAVVGLKGTVQDIDGKETLTRVGVTCALCHSTVDNSFASGIGHRLDGWPNRDLNPGAIIALSPAIPDTYKAVYNSWGPGKYDARFNLFVQSKGLAFFTDGQNPPHDRFAVEIPPAYGLLGIVK